jgi:hypothetical protein
MSSCLYVALARKLKQYSPYQLVVSSDKISGNSFNSIFLFNPNLERDSNSLAIARFQAALIIHNLVQIPIICRGWGRCYIASGQAGKAQCVYWLSTGLIFQPSAACNLQLLVQFGPIRYWHSQSEAWQIIIGADAHVAITPISVCITLLARMCLHVYVIHTLISKAILMSP